jgi:hypothetical protein
MARNEDQGWNIYQRSDGQWVLQYRRAPGNWRERGIPRAEHTERRPSAGRSCGSPSTGRPRAPGPCSLSRTRTRDRRSATSRATGSPSVSATQSSRPRSSQNDSNIDTHVLPHGEVADAPIADLGPAVLRAWVRKVRDLGLVIRTKKMGSDGKDVVRETRGPLAPMTVRNVVGTLTQFFDDAMAEEWTEITANPMRHPGVRKEIPEGVTRAELRGMRRGEKAHGTQVRTPNAPIMNLGWGYSMNVSATANHPIAAAPQTSRAGHSPRSPIARRATRRPRRPKSTWPSAYAVFSP